jgi:hypothetical protein
MTGFSIARLILCLVLTFSALAPALAQARFISGTEDLPLMTGLDEVEDGGLVFDTPAGRLVEARAEGALAASAVRAFYAETLPQLGWRSLENGAYAREGEVLTIDITEGNGRLAVRFALTPQSQ